MNTTLNTTCSTKRSATALRRSAVAFIALAASIGTIVPTFAQDAEGADTQRLEQQGPRGERGERGPRQRGSERDPRRMFQMADADGSGDISLEEFTAALQGRFDNADADGDGSITVAELADSLQRNRSEQMAERMIRRFDTDENGSIEQVDLVAFATRGFERMDRNEDGVIERSELRGMRGMHRGERGDRGGRDHRD